MLLDKTRPLRGWNYKALFSNTEYSLITQKMLLASNLYFKPQKLTIIFL